MEFKAGDVVILKSGGPTMTVEVKTLAGHYTCVWMDSSGKLGRETFAPELLMSGEMSGDAFFTNDDE